jgi:hypothetical protein
MVRAMGKAWDGLGKLDQRGFHPILLDLNRQAWDGVLRARSSSAIAAIWLVKGHVVHALNIQGTVQVEGLAALESVAGWTEGTIYLEKNVLPPARTIRSEMGEVLAALARPVVAADMSEPADRKEENLEGVFDTLRQKVPGLESLSLSNGSVLRATTEQDAGERSWLSRQLETCCHEELASTERLYLQQGEHALLILKSGSFATVLSARKGTSPEALFWAGEEAMKRVLSGE